MFADTITFTINAVAKVLTRINQDSYSSEYLLREPDSEFRARIRNSSYTDKASGKKVSRHNVELVQTVYPTTEAGLDTIRKTYMVFEDYTGDNINEVNDFVDGHVAFLTTGNILKLLNWES